MKAIVYTEYGAPEVLKLRDVKQPVPSDNEILIKIFATTVSSGDWHVRKADPFIVRLFFGFLRPKNKILGGVLAGVVTETGKEVTRFTEGDRIFGSTGMHFGAYAEYTCLPEDAVLAKMPEHLSFEEATSIPFGANTALYFLRKANLQKNSKILIFGASGAVGTAAIQIASHHYEAEVTALCSTGNIELVKSLGAHKVIDYTKQDFSKSADVYDVIYETVGKASLADCLRVLSKDRILLLNAAGLKHSFQGLWNSLIGRQKIVSGVMKETKEDMQFIYKLIEEGKLKPVIDKYYTLSEIPEVHRYVEKGHKKGNVVVTVQNNDGRSRQVTS